MERRKSPRFKARFDALYSSGAQEGAGVLAEISYAGVRLEESSIRPEIGTRVVLYIFVRPVQPFELVGTGRAPHRARVRRSRSTPRASRSAAWSTTWLRW